MDVFWFVVSLVIFILGTYLLMADIDLRKHERVFLFLSIGVAAVAFFYFLAEIVSGI